MRESAFGELVSQDIQEPAKTEVKPNPYFISRMSLLPKDWEKREALKNVMFGAATLVASGGMAAITAERTFPGLIPQFFDQLKTSLDTTNLRTTAETEFQDYGNEFFDTLGAQMYSEIKTENPQALQEIPYAPLQIKELQRADRKAYPSPPPDEVRHYLTPTGHADIAEGIVDMYLLGKINFAGQNENIPLTTGQIQAQADKLVAQIQTQLELTLLRTRHEKHKSPTKISTLNKAKYHEQNPQATDHHVSQALLTRGDVMQEIADFMIAHEAALPGMTINSAKLQENISDEISPGKYIQTHEYRDQALEHLQTRQAYKDFEALLHATQEDECTLSIETDLPPVQDLLEQTPIEFQTWFAHHYRDQHGSFKPGAESLLRNAVNLSHNGKLNLLSIGTHVMQPWEFFDQVCLEKPTVLAKSNRLPASLLTAAGLIPGAAAITSLFQKGLSVMKHWGRKTDVTGYSRRRFLQGSLALGTTLVVGQTLARPETTAAAASISRDFAQKFSPEALANFDVQLGQLMRENPLALLPGPIYLKDTNNTLIEQTNLTQREDCDFDAEIPRAQLETLFSLQTGVEDSNFFDHNGCDPRGLARAVDNVRKGKMEGASTITMQVVEMLSLNPDERKQTLLDKKQAVEWKATEILLASTWEKALTEQLGSKRAAKEHILKLYLNAAPYGSNIIGIKAAAKEYFDKELKDLSKQEMVFLVGLPQGPSLYDPRIDEHASFERYKSVLNLLMLKNRISSQEYFRFKPQPKVKPLNFEIHEPTEQIDTKSFQLYVSQTARENIPADRLAEGLDITTSLDLRLQKNVLKISDEFFKNNTTALHANHADVIIRDADTGEILAFTGDPTQELTADGFAKFITSTQALIQGTLEADSQLDMTANTLADLALQSPDARNTASVSWKYALKTKDRYPWIRLAQHIGTTGFLDIAKRIGLIDRYDDIQARSWTTSAGDNLKTNLLRLVNSYGVISNNGTRIESSPISRIVQHNHLAYEVDRTLSQQTVIDPHVAQVITSATHDAGTDLSFIADIVTEKNRTSSLWSVGTVKTATGRRLSIGTVLHSYETDHEDKVVKDQYGRPKKLALAWSDTEQKNNPAYKLLQEIALQLN
ncbi:MAG: transglycosylase domain-containing protein [Weeksellaceae bacterium]